MINKIKYFIIFLLFSLHSQIYATDAWILWWWWAIWKEKIRNWDFHTNDIPIVLKWAIDYLLFFAGTISLIFVIVWAYRIALWTLEWDKSKWKETIYYALAWFVLASCSWLIMKLIIDNFS